MATDSSNKKPRNANAVARLPFDQWACEELNLGPHAYQDSDPLLSDAHGRGCTPLQRFNAY